MLQGHSLWVAQWVHGPPTLITGPNKVQQFQLQTSGILLFTGVQKLKGPKISQFSLFNVGPSEKFLIVNHLKEEHNEQEVKH